MLLRAAPALAVTAIAAQASAAGPFARGPFLQSLGPSGVTLKVELLTPEPVTVEVTGPDGAVVQKEAAAEARRFQAVRIEGLSPGTAYRYRVLAGASAQPSDEGRFTTAPSDARPFDFIVYGDSRSDPGAHAAVVRAIEGQPSDFLVHTGDMVALGDEEDDWKGFFDVENRLLRDRCVFASVGNHELAGEHGVGATAFLRYFAAADEGGKDRPKLYGTFRWSNTRFFLLNAMDAWTGEERAWLKEELDRALSEEGLVHRFAVLHHGPFSSGPHGGNKKLHDNGVIELLRDGKVDLVLAGHDHAYERGSGQGLKYVVSGGAGAPLYPRRAKGAETAIYESVHHFVQMHVDGERVDLLAKRASGSVLEKCHFVGNGPWNCEAGGGMAPASGPAASPPVAAPAASGACLCSAPGASAGGSGLAAAAAGLAIAGCAARRRRRSPSSLEPA
jgi:hypothetical protein